MERKTDLRVLKTRTAIKNTFKEMVMEMNASDIQIKELTERAMIHRKTFYLHYTCIVWHHYTIERGSHKEQS